MPRSTAAASQRKNNRQESSNVSLGSGSKKLLKQRLNSTSNSNQSQSAPSKQRQGNNDHSSAATDKSESRQTSNEDFAPVAHVTEPDSPSKMDANGHLHPNWTAKSRSESNRSTASSVSEAPVSPSAAPRSLEKLSTPTSNKKRAAFGSGSSPPASTTHVNPFTLASTILKSCPMYDTVAILIFLLQLPPIVLTLVQFLFASLTFMPPAGISASSLRSNFDIFQGPAGTPSLTTMIVMDGICLVIWCLLMWTWAQNFAVDLAQVQIAITLGGGGSGKEGGVNMLCVLIVFAVHIVRSQGVQEVFLARLVSLPKAIFASFPLPLPLEIRRRDPPSPPSWTRSLLTVHILAQAGIAMARRSIARNRSPPPTPTLGKRNDMEASAGSSSNIDSFDSPGDNSLCASSANSSPFHSPATKDNRDRNTNTKKRRRQANQVRSRQPFWAALASTKVTVMREYEQSVTGHWGSALSNPLAESDLEASALDDVWITQIDSCSIQFATSDLSLSHSDDLCSSFFSDVDNDEAVIDDRQSGRDEKQPAKPFSVYVNGALWTTVSMTRVPWKPGMPSLVRWRGAVSGLAPDCTYSCSFVRSDTGAKVCNMTVKTPPAFDVEVPSPSSNSASQQPSLRPASPTTTMKKSIAALEVMLGDRRARLRKSKSDHKTYVSRIKKEIDNYNNRLNSENDENRQHQRIFQLNHAIRQTEEAIVDLDRCLRENETVPQEELKEWTSCRALLDEKVERLNDLKSELEADKVSAQRDSTTAQNDLSNVIQKHERLRSRCKRLRDQLERVISANNQGLDEREQRVAEQLAKERDQAHFQETCCEHIDCLAQKIHTYQSRTSVLWQHASAIEQEYQARRRQKQQSQQHDQAKSFFLNSDSIKSNEVAPLGIASGFSSAQDLFAPTVPFPSTALDDSNNDRGNNISSGGMSERSRFLYSPITRRQHSSSLNMSSPTLMTSLVASSEEYKPPAQSSPASPIHGSSTLSATPTSAAAASRGLSARSPLSYVDPPSQSEASRAAAVRRRSQSTLSLLP